MALLVWFTLGVALWHFTVFVPDHFVGGIVGAFLAAIAGAIVSGALWQVAPATRSARPTSSPSSPRFPGCLIALAIVYVIGSRDPRHQPAALRRRLSTRELSPIEGLICGFGAPVPSSNGASLTG